MPALIAFLIQVPRIAFVALSIARQLQSLGRSPAIHKVFSSRHPLWGRAESIRNQIERNRALLQKMPSILQQLEGELSDLGQIMIGR